jgi:hypothetical protein
MQFRFAFEGFPDSVVGRVGEYANAAQAFVHLSQLLGDPQYADFAAQINDGLWNSRLNQSTYLMPDTVTTLGPLAGDQDVAAPFKYKHDTDCIYWARGMFEAYRVGGGMQAQLVPSASESVTCTLAGIIFGDQAALRCQTGTRRKRLDALLSGGFPNKYLGMALGLTLDWIRYGWFPQWNQFVRKIHHDGTQGDTRIYGDGKWNTLYMLIAAYEFTHDDFYLRLFDRAWQHFEALAQSHPELSGLFPDNLDSGNLAQGPPVIETLQEAFLDVIVSAYLATVNAGTPLAGYLTKAKDVADKIIAAHKAGKDYYFLYNGLLGRSLLRIARAAGTLRRITINLFESNITTLNFQSGASGSVGVDLLGHQRAVVYMDDGQCNVVKQFADGTEAPPITLVVAGNTEVNL